MWPLFPLLRVGYHEGRDTPPWGQAPITYGPGRYMLTQLIRLTSGQVLRGAGMDQTTLVFPSLTAMGQGAEWDWWGGVISLDGTEVGLEDLTIEFAPHAYQHHGLGQGWNGPDVLGTHCWVRNVRVVNYDVGILCGAEYGTIENLHLSRNVGGDGAHIDVGFVGASRCHMRGGRVERSPAIHGVAGNWGAQEHVIEGLIGAAGLVVEPNHNGPASGKFWFVDVGIESGAVALQWGQGNQHQGGVNDGGGFVLTEHSTSPLYRTVAPPVPPPTSPVSNLARQAVAAASSSWSSGYTPEKANDGDDGTRWNSAAGDKVGAWWQLDWPAPVTISGVLVREGIARVTGYVCERWDGATGWIPLAGGGVAGTRLSFPSVSLQRLRVRVTSLGGRTENWYTPTFAEVEVFA